MFSISVNPLNVCLNKRQLDFHIPTFCLRSSVAIHFLGCSEIYTRTDMWLEMGGAL